MLILPPRAMTTPSQDLAMIEARVAFMRQCPFFCYFYYDKIQEWPTHSMPTAATDGRRLYYNPEWFALLRPPERCFVLAHEMYHVIWQHCQKARVYDRDKHVDGTPYDHDLMNRAEDYVINADLVQLRIGLCNPEWLYDTAIKGTDDIVEVYKKLWAEKQQQPSLLLGVTYGRGSQPDKAAKGQGGRFDDVMAPPVDKATGEVDEIGEIAFKEAVARAAMHAKAVGNMPGTLERLVGEILEPQVDWKDKVRMILTGHIGRFRENWATPNRRRIVMPQMVYLPGKRGHGADLVAIWIDCSGSVGDREYDAFFSEVGGIMQDVRPRRMLVGWCDADVKKTEWVDSLDEVYGLMREPVPGRGGTSFKPPFYWMAAEGIVPDTCVYLTDGYGPFPDKPTFPVVWTMSTDQVAPFGDTVQIKP
jgi:predicted metal-dependent peptidase